MGLVIVSENILEELEIWPSLIISVRCMFFVLLFFGMPKKYIMYREATQTDSLSLCGSMSNILLS